MKRYSYQKLAIALGLALSIASKYAPTAAAQDTETLPSPVELTVPSVDSVEPERIPDAPDVLLESPPSSSEIDLIDASECLPLAETDEPRFEAAAIAVVGSSVLQDEIAAIVGCYEGVPITLSDLFILRSQITQLYFENGYITSGAFIPSSQFLDDEIQVQVIEGKLSDVQINGLNRLNNGYVEARIARADGPPLNQERLQEALQLLQLDPNIENVNAELTAGTQPGESLLILDIEETRSFSVIATADNNRSPSVGSEELRLSANYRNLIGVGDAISASYGITEGLNLYNVGVSVPLNASDGSVSISYSNNDSRVIEDIFEDAGIRSETETVSVAVRQPIVRSPSEEFALGLAFDWRQSQSFILDDVPFSFSIGPDDGRSQVSALRFSQEWTKRNIKRVLAARSQFSVGLDVLGATNNDTGTDGQFFAWLGQFQWVEQISPRSISLLKVNAQLTPDSLLPIERFSLGGINTVRGYAQNQIVTDNAINASAEVRIPLTRNTNTLQIVPFVDAGYGWNNRVATPDNNFLLGTGVGLRWQPTSNLLIRSDYGVPLINGDQGGSLQENGFYFSLIYQIE